MNKRTIWSLVALLAIIAVLVWTTSSTMKPQQNVDNGAQLQETTVTFYDQITKEETTATFTADSVTFTNAKLGTMTLPQTISASGARYADADESIVFWNKGDSVFITQNGTIVFNGSTGMPAENPDSQSAKLPAGSTASNPSQLEGQTWVWSKTVMNNDTIITPKKADAFTVTFAADGKINGTTDCNGFFGSYRAGSDSVIAIGPLASTLMYCEGSQENDFRKDIEQSNSYMIDKDGNLILMLPYDSGSIIFKKK